MDSAAPSVGVARGDCRALLVGVELNELAVPILTMVEAESEKEAYVPPL
jgi:hypothetical protein